MKDLKVASDDQVTTTLDAREEARQRRQRRVRAKLDGERTPEQTRTLRYVSAADIDTLSIDWSWADYLPVGHVGLLAGREGLGKSLLTLWIAARLSQGDLPGVHHGTPKRTIILASEDSWGAIIKPRLLAAGADLAYVGHVVVETAKTDDDLTLPTDLLSLQQLIESFGDIALIVLDPVISRLSGQLDTHVDAKVRQALNPLGRLAEATKATVVGIIHVNKTATTDPLNAVMGSRAFTAFARFVLFVCEDPNDESVKLFGQPKNNFGAKAQTRTFEIDKVVPCQDQRGRDIETGTVRWTGTDPRSIREILQEASEAKNPGQAAQGTVWLRSFLLRHGGCVEYHIVKHEGQLENFSISTLKRAAKKLNVTIVPAGFPKRTFWVLPGHTLNLTNLASGGTP